MVFKALKIIAILTVAALIPISAMAGSRTLCDLFDKPGGNFRVYYDLRTYDYETVPQYPQGGIKFELALPLYDTEIERDAFLKKIKRVVLYNMSTGNRYIVKSALTYKYWDRWTDLDGFTGEYSLHIGHSSHVLGDWKVIVYGERWWNPYKAYFTLTQEMLDQEAPIPVDATVSSDSNGGPYHVTCDYKGAELYRLRVFDDEDMVWETNMICHIYTHDPSMNFCEAYVPSQYGGYRARIEARIGRRESGLLLWPLLMQWFEPDTCKPDGMITDSGFARSITWFDIEE